MEPTLEINDIIVVKKTADNDLKKGDIVAFEQDGKIISHRIVQIINKTENKVFVTKGDNNKVEDDGYLQPEKVYGKVIFHIPKIGELVEYIKNKAGFMRAILIILIVFVLIWLRDGKKNRRKMIRKKYEIKKKRELYK